MNSETFSRIKYSDKKWSKLSKPEIVRIKKAVALISNGKNVLDVGAYNGNISKLIKEQGNSVSATDAADRFLKNFSDAGIEFRKSDLEKELPFRSSSFDVVFAGEVIEHLVDTDNFLDEIFRVLKKDGFLVLTTPNIASAARRLLLLLGKNPHLEVSYEFPSKIVAGHLRYFTFNLLEKFLEYHKFTVEVRMSDVVNLTNNLSSEFLANMFPTLGRSIIVKATKK